MCSAFYQINTLSISVACNKTLSSLVVRIQCFFLKDESESAKFDKRRADGVFRHCNKTILVAMITETLKKSTCGLFHSTNFTITSVLPITETDLAVAIIHSAPLKVRLTWYALFFFSYKNIVFPAQAEYSYFSTNVRLKIFLWIFLYYSVWHFRFRMYWGYQTVNSIEHLASAGFYRFIV